MSWSMSIAPYSIHIQLSQHGYLYYIPAFTIQHCYLISYPFDGDPEIVELMKNPSTPQRFWLPLLYDSLKLLNWQNCPLLSVSETNLLLNKLQELSLARLRPHYSEPSLPSDALSSIRLALATNLGRAILDE